MASAEADICAPAQLARLAAQELDAMTKAGSRETGYLEVFMVRIRGHLGSQSGLRGLTASDLEIYRKAIEEATGFRASDLEGLTRGLELMLELLDAAKDGSLFDEEARTLAAFVWSLADSSTRAKSPAGLRA